MHKLHYINLHSIEMFLYIVTDLASFSLMLPKELTACQQLTLHSYNAYLCIWVFCAPHVTAQPAVHCD